MRKTSSTNSLNEKLLMDTCGMAYSMSIIGGRWKPTILCQLVHGARRYGELKKSITGISERMLVAQLKELEKQGVVERLAYAEIPPRVEYKLSKKGETMKPLLQLLSDWGNQHRPR